MRKINIDNGRFNLEDEIEVVLKVKSRKLEMSYDTFSKKVYWKKSIRSNQK